MAGNLLQRIKQVFCGKPKSATCWCQCEAKSSHVSDDELRKIIKEKKLNHIAIIADGNRRWAKKRGLSPVEGHRVGFVEVAPEICCHLWDLGVHTVSIWCLSTGNWKREKEEVENLLDCCEKLVQKMRSSALNLGLRIIHLGRKDRIPQSLRLLLEVAESETKKHSKHVFNVCIDYGGADEICRACQKIFNEDGETKKFTSDVISQHLDTADQPFPTPDLIIRSAGEQRLSGFMMWQSIYSELLFTENYFPDFNSEILKKSILQFAQRTRTFSK